MYKILVIVLLAFMPVCTGLNCYTCASGLTGCNDPFNATSYNVTQVSLSANLYCVKQGLTSLLISRYGSPTCDASTFIFGIGKACCQMDLCNSVSTNYKTPMLIIISFFIMLYKLY